MDCEYCGFSLCRCGECHNERCEDYMESFEDCNTVEEDYDDIAEVSA